MELMLALRSILFIF